MKRCVYLLQHGLHRPWHTGADPTMTCVDLKSLFQPKWFYVEWTILYLPFCNFSNALRILENIFIQLYPEHTETGDLYEKLYLLPVKNPFPFITCTIFSQINVTMSVPSNVSCKAVYLHSCSQGTGSQTPVLKEGIAFLVFSSPKQSLARCLLLFPQLYTLILAEEKFIPSLFLSAHTSLMACAGALLCCPQSPNIRQGRQQDPGCLVLLPVSPSRDILLMPGPEPDLIWRYLAWKLPLKVKAMGDPRSFSQQQSGSSAVTFSGKNLPPASGSQSWTSLGRLWVH